ncbi:MAG: hypothetical protein CSB44_07045 [Gammaproteobacteria bacterium]|nr:MAG: hypothetical protein CSB44_07045 [Gammaproteobacteria bacterium]
MLLLSLCGLSAAHARPHEPLAHARVLERQLDVVLEHLDDGQHREASAILAGMARRFPESRLTHYLRAELLRREFGGLAGNDLAQQQTGFGLLLEARSRLAALRARQQRERSATERPGLLPATIIQTGKAVDEIVVVDVAGNTLYRVDDTGVLAEHYVSIGINGFGKRREGDGKTPLGIYDIQTFRSDASLPRLYGSGALTLDYPNIVDREQGRDGSGIWLHGVPHGQYSRAPQSSEGCVTMANQHLSDLARTARPGTARVILETVPRWHDAHERQLEQQRFREQFRRYQDAWRQADETTLAALYRNPADVGSTLRQFGAAAGDAASLKRVSRPGAGLPGTEGSLIDRLIALPAEDVTILRYPNSDLVLMEARVGADPASRLVLYWQRADSGNWQIAHEIWMDKGI